MKVMLFSQTRQGEGYTGARGISREEAIRMESLPMWYFQRSVWGLWQCHCFKDIFQDPSACMIQERRWWDVGRFSQLELQRCELDGSHTHESPCGSGQEFRQQLAMMWSWAWAA